ncbi:glycosyltransferase family 2 protein [Halomarina oriensis]|uniref:Glycosyltransferase n=1 Tax=Halomarina oriensis TaxID=671145 RepID=A0A6B0GRM5_9EURY|nr:glycosyltransferase family 2 protein [Halomarina oriensis]MWG36299.1 glycosyltransferase [Halomarina oriensis]
MSEELAGVRGQKPLLARLAVGLIATGENDERVLHELFWAATNDQEVYVTYSTQPVPAVVEFARRAGGVVIDPHDWTGDIDTIERQFVEAIRVRTDRPVVVHREHRYTGSDSLRGRVGISDTVVAVPAYNEAGSIADVVENALAVVDTVVVVDDGSEDDTALVAERAGATVVSHDRNEGYGGALRTAFRTAAELGAEHLVTLDADGQHDPRDIPRLVDRLGEKKADIVIGSRYADGGGSDCPRYRRVGLWVINTLTNLSLGFWRSDVRIHDTQSGFRAYNARAIGELATSPNVGDGMGASIDILYHAHHHNYTIEEVGTAISYAVEKGSTFGPVSHGYTLVRNIFRTVERDRPLSVLGVPGFVTILLGLVLGYSAVTTFSRAGTVPVELGLLATFSLMMGFLACFTAVILHALHTYFDPV